jgi:hypothetical protein
MSGQIKLLVHLICRASFELLLTIRGQLGITQLYRLYPIRLSSLCLNFKTIGLE